jgi:transposase
MEATYRMTIMGEEIMAFIRTVKVKTSSGAIEEYVRIVESCREGDRQKQRVIAHLGNIKSLKNDAKKIVNGLLRVVGEKPLTFASDGKLLRAKEYGVRFVVEALWDELGFNRLVTKGLRKSKADLDYGRWIRMMVVNKLSDPLSKLGIFRWLHRVWWPGHGFQEEVCNESVNPEERLELSRGEVMKFYRAMDYLFKLKEEIENHIYHLVRDLFHLEVDLIFYDLTSSYFEGEGPGDFAKEGYSRDHEPGKNQIVIGILLCNGMPIGHEVFEGSRVDKKTVKEISAKIKNQFKINRCIFVGDRGLISRENLKELEDEKRVESILALKRRRNREVREVLCNKDRPLMFCRESEELEWLETKGDEGIRYIICHNPSVEVEQKEQREKNLALLEEALKELQAKVNAMKRPSIKNVVKQVEEILTHKHGRRFIDYQVDEKTRKLSFWRKEESLLLEEKLDGVYILRTREEALSPLEVIKAYKDLMIVERAFRTMKSSLELRPLRHHKADRVRSHVFICVLAFFFTKYLEKKLKESKVSLSAEMAWESLKNLSVGQLDFNGTTHSYVSEPTYYHKLIFKSLGLNSPNRTTL